MSKACESCIDILSEYKTKLDRYVPQVIQEMKRGELSPQELEIATELLPILVSIHRLSEKAKTPPTQNKTYRTYRTQEKFNEPQVPIQNPSTPILSENKLSIPNEVWSNYDLVLFLGGQLFYTNKIIVLCVLAKEEREKSFAYLKGELASDALEGSLTLEPIQHSKKRMKTIITNLRAQYQSHYPVISALRNVFLKHGFQFK